MAGSPLELPPLSDGDFDLSEGLGNESENASLRALIEGEIREQGPITFRRFMELVLYHPTEGYYNSSRERIGRAGDYVTSPELSPLFGYAIARQLAELWRSLDSPSRFFVVEHGAGNGRLARDVLHWTAQREPELYDALTYALIETSRSLRALASEAFSPLVQSGKVEIASKHLTRREARCLLANELIDSFPVHRVTAQGGSLDEVYVALTGDAFVETIGPLSTPELRHYFSRLGLLPGEGCTVEVNLDAGVWLPKAADSIDQGYILVLDYGYTAERLFAPWRRYGTLLCYRRHEVSDDPYHYLGRQDITSHIDFTSLTRYATDAGLQVAGFTDQARFLTGLGAAQSLRPPQAGERGMADYFARRRALAALTDHGGLGRIGVLLLGKNAPAASFLGFPAGPASPLTHPVS